MATMAKLILSMDGLVLKEIPLTQQRTSIGRKPQNDIQIDNLAISGEHAVIVTILNDSFLEDLNSTNGTYVNGQPIKKHILQNNDVVELGKYRIKFLVEPAATIAMTEYDKGSLNMPPPGGEDASATQPVGAGGMVGAQPEVQTMQSVLAQAGLDAQAATSGPVGVITIRSGANAGRELELTKSITTLGKTGAQVAVITRRPQGYFMTHVEGDKFPLLNGKPIDAQAHPLTDHDVIEIAGTRMEFSLKP